MMLVEGTLSDTTIDPVVVSINGDRYLMRTNQGRFSRKFPAASGKNVVTVLATNKAGTANAQATTLRADSARAPQGHPHQRHRGRLHGPPHLRAHRRQRRARTGRSWR